MLPRGLVRPSDKFANLLLYLSVLAVDSRRKIASFRVELRKPGYDPSAGAMAQELLDGNYIQADDTPVGVQPESACGKNLSRVALLNRPAHCRTVALFDECPLSSGLTYKHGANDHGPFNDQLWIRSYTQQVQPVVQYRDNQYPQ